MKVDQSESVVRRGPRGENGWEYLVSCDACGLAARWSTPFHECPECGSSYLRCEEVPE